MTVGIRVGVIGLGVLGKPVAQRLVSQGFDVAAFDVRREPVSELAKAGAHVVISGRSRETQ